MSKDEKYDLVNVQESYKGITLAMDTLYVVIYTGNELPHQPI